MAASKLSLPDLECPAFAALMLAGGQAPPDLAVLGATDRALVPLLNLPVVRYGLTALSRCPEIDAITAVGPPSLQGIASEFGAAWIQSGGSMLNNLQTGLEALARRDWVLITGADTPLLTGEILSSLLKECACEEADIYYPIVPRDVLERRYPGGKRTWVTLTEGTYTGGNVFLVRPQAILDNRALFDKVIAARKNPLQLAGLFGMPFIGKLLMKHLSMEELEARATTLLKAQVRAIVTPHPEIGLDLDKIADHAQLTTILTDKQTRHTGYFTSISLP